MFDFSDIAQRLAAAMAAQKESLLRSVIPGNWSLSEIKARCAIQISLGSNPVETFFVDGVPVLEIYPAEWEVVESAGTTTLLSTQKYRRLTHA